MPNVSGAALQRLAYSPAETAAVVGISRQHVHNLIARGAIRSVLIGKSRRIPASEVERLLLEGTAQAKQLQEFVERTTAASGVPAKLEDPAVAEQVATILRGAS
jgi:excisionase family DNA binding protein